MPTILHLIPTLEGGGAERQMLLLAKEQARRGSVVHVASRRGGVHEIELREAGIIGHPLGDFRGFNPSLLRRIHSLVRRIEPDVLQTWLPQMDIVGGTIALWSSVPWVLSERAAKEAYLRPPVAMWVRHCLGRYARAVVANSVGGAQYWSDHRSDGRVTVITNAVSLTEIENAEPWSYQSARGGENVLLFVGRMVPEKGPGTLIEAVKQLIKMDNIRVLFIGEGPLRDEILADVQACGLEARINIAPYQSSWWGLLKTCTALINISRFEGQPNVVLEAMAARCPLIVSDIPAHREILNNESALMVPPNDATALANAIVTLLSDASAARQRARRAYERVSESTIDSVTDAYERVYETVLKGARR
jgi:glycosyltransferase involved in cell wall biosynthesis